jgi:Domain of unknown function (DUF1918)
MQARVGDWIVIDSGGVDTPHREGQIVALRHHDGAPPYEVHWFADGKTTLYFPGRDARVLTHGEYQALHHQARTAASAGGRR